MPDSLFLAPEVNRPSGSPLQVIYEQQNQETLGGHITSLGKIIKIWNYSSDHKVTRFCGKGEKIKVNLSFYIHMHTYREREKRERSEQ